MLGHLVVGWKPGLLPGQVIVLGYQMYAHKFLKVMSVQGAVSSLEIPPVQRPGMAYNLLSYRLLKISRALV